MHDNEIRNGLIKYNAHAARWTKENSKHLATPFPRGIIRPLTDLRSRWPYLSRADARTVSCAIQLCDVNRFYMHTYSVRLTAGTMWEWHVTLPVIAVIETLCGKVIAKEEWGLGKNFNMLQKDAMKSAASRNSFNLKYLFDCLPEWLNGII